jgi:hypothetical protein
MMRLRRASAIVALSLLASAATAHAECAHRSCRMMSMGHT